MTYEKHGALTYVRNEHSCFNATIDLNLTESFRCLNVRKLRLFHNVNLHHIWNIKSLTSLLEV